MRPPTESDANWDPRILDEEFGEEFHDSVMELPEVQECRDSRDPRVDAQGNLRRTWDEYQLLFNAADEHIAANMRPVEYEECWYNASTTGVVFLDEDGEMMDYLPRPKGIFTSKVERLANMPYHLFPNLHYPFRKHFKSRFPAANVPCLNEWQATDTFFSDTPAADDGIPGHAGCTMMQLFYGMSSGHTSGYPMQSEKQVGEVYEDHIRKVGAPVGILSDRA
eukprot:scaffold4236_cov101-Amphora_coffeaeformis.AAC.1